MIHDLNSICERSGIDHKKLTDVLAFLPAVKEGGPWLCGGALRRLLNHDDPLSSDLDFFFANEGQCEDFVKELEENAHVKRLPGTKTARTFKVSAPGHQDPVIVQAIELNYYPSVEACIDTFDFTICQFGFDGEKLHCGEFSLWDLGRKKLVIHKVTYAAATVRRLLKYTKQGFTACKGVAFSILDAVAKDPSVIHPEVEYVD